jgi:hypothetical protein
LPLEKVFVSRQSSNEEYQKKMSDCLLAYKARGVTGCVFGDIFLEDLRLWREQNLALVGLRGDIPPLEGCVERVDPGIHQREIWLGRLLHERRLLGRELCWKNHRC